jgi:hypothetical protein
VEINGRRRWRRNVSVAASLAASTAALSAGALAATAEAPSNTVQPSINGTAKIGEELTVDNGTWTNSPTGFGYQWQRCASSGCTDISGATGKTYGVRNADAGDTLRVAVKATNASGSTTVFSDRTATVPSAGTTTVVTTTAPTPNRAPSLAFLSMRRVGITIYVRFRVCDDSVARVKVLERDRKPGVKSYLRQYAVKGKPCATHSRHWGLPQRFRYGRYTATLRAHDRQGAWSPVRSRTLYHR